MKNRSHTERACATANVRIKRNLAQLAKMDEPAQAAILAKLIEVAQLLESAKMNDLAGMVRAAKMDGSIDSVTLDEMFESPELFDMV